MKSRMRLRQDLSNGLSLIDHKYIKKYTKKYKKNMVKVLNNVKPSASGDPAALETPNYISQINAGGELYDIATHHGIKFFNGAADNTGIVWNGITDLEVRIPVITDLINTPIQFAGTVDETGAIIYNPGVEETPKSGYLVFITKDCKFNEIACEAGDMAVYDGLKWNVVTGENQVEILNVGENNIANVVLTAVAKDVLTVEGKHLHLSVDYTGVEDVLKIDRNAKVELTTKDGTTTVEPMYIKLTKAADTTSTIGETKTLNIPTKLADGAVTINEKVLSKKDFTFTAGTLPTIKKNDKAIAATVNKTLAVGKKGENGAEGDYVATIDNAIKSATLTQTDTAAGATLSFVKGLTQSAGDKFVNGIHVATGDEEIAGKGDFVIPGKASMAGKTFVTGLGDAEAAEGDVLSSVSVGAVTISKEGTDVVTGLGVEKTDATGQVITSVTPNSIAQDASKTWFYSGLSDAKTTGFDVVTNIEIGDVSLVADAASNLKKSVLETATVNDHVLSFGKVDVSAPVKVSQAKSTISGKSFIQSGVKLEGFAVKSADLVKGGISQADTTVKYKSFTTGSDALTYADDVKYYFDKVASSKYTADMGYATFTTVNSVITKNTPVLQGEISVSVPTNSVAVDFADAGELPSLNIAEVATGALTASVDTALTTAPESFIALKSEDINVSGAYTLETPETGEDAITVAKAGAYGLDGAHCDIPEDSFVTNVSVKKNA